MFRVTPVLIVLAVSVLRAQDPTGAIEGAVLDPARNTMRLSFSTVPPDKIRMGVAILAELIRARM